MQSDDQTSRQIELLHLKVKRLLAQNQTDEMIIEELKKMDGIEAHYALLLIDNVNNDKSDKKSFRNSVIMGLFYIVSGLLINLFSYKIALSRYSLFFYVTWGIIAFGIVTVARGFIIYKK
ncbi:MAG: hypothetical protein V4722_23490 [Bacteroidota bacterium]